MEKKIKEEVYKVLSTLPNVYFPVEFDTGKKSYNGMANFDRENINIIINIPAQIYYINKNNSQVERTIRHEYRHMQQYWWLYQKGGFELVDKVEKVFKKNFSYIKNPLELDAFEFQGIVDNKYPDENPIDVVMEKIYNIYLNL